MYNDGHAYVHIGGRGYTVRCRNRPLELFNRLVQIYIPNQFRFLSGEGEDEFITFIKNNSENVIDILAGYGLKDIHSGDVFKHR